MTEPPPIMMKGESRWESRSYRLVPIISHIFVERFGQGHKIPSYSVIQRDTMRRRKMIKSERGRYSARNSEIDLNAVLAVEI